MRERARRIDAEHEAAQRQQQLADEEVAIEAQLTEHQRRREALDTEQGRLVNNTTARVRARHVAAALSRDEAPRAPFARASQNVAAATALLETLRNPLPARWAGSTTGSRKSSTLPLPSRRRVPFNDGRR